MKPWREVLRPHSDVRNGVISTDTFAANLQSVADAESAYDEYTNAIEFFNRSFVTPGLKSLLVNTVKRINGRGGDPVVQMKTGFGGGKTHSLIALYHLINSGVSISSLAINPTDPTGETLKQVFDDAGVDPSESASAQVVVLSGTERSATESTTSEHGDYRLNTLWGYMADGLGEAEGFEFVREASESWTAPVGSELMELFDYVGPCVILIDELVAYARNLPEGRDGSFFTFLQNLTETVGRRDDVALVVTVPAAKEEVGGDAGAEALAKVQERLDSIEHVLRRMESISAPLETHEAFEVVRRRLFEREPLDSQALQDTCGKFFRMYTKYRNEYPDHASSGAYHARLLASYPIHPEMFDRLFEDWSAINAFQRTRGALRLIATAIKRLMDTSNDPMLMPGSLPLADNVLSNEFTGILSGNWVPAVEELDGPNSRADGVDRATSRFSKFGGGVSKRIARTVFLGSAPASQTGATVTGITEAQIRLGTVQPGENIAIYNEARDKLAQELHFLHQRESRFFFHTNPNLLKVHQDISNRIPDDDVDEKVRLIINEMVAGRIDDDLRPIVFPTSDSEIADDEVIKLVVIHPGIHIDSSGNEPDTAFKFAERALINRGDNLRLRRNTVLFLTAERENINELRQETRAFLGWETLAGNRSEHHLNAEQAQQARRRRNEAERLVEDRLVAAYREAIAPQQKDPRKSDYVLRRFTADRTRGAHIIANAANELKSKSELVYKLGHRQFTEIINEYFLKNGVDHYEIGEIWDTHINQVYMHRFVNRGVFEDALKQAVEQGTYRIASGYNPTDGYSADAGDRHFRENGRLIVRTVAFDAHQIRKQKHAAGGASGGRQVKPEPPTPPTGKGQKPEEPKPESRQLVATKVMDGQAAIDGDYNQIRDEVVKVLNTIGGDVKVRIIVEAENRTGFNELQLNAVRQNGEQLGFKIDSLN